MELHYNKRGKTRRMKGGIGLVYLDPIHTSTTAHLSAVLADPREENKDRE